jgi:hypothetical protein
VASSPVTFLNPLNGDVDVTFSPCTTIGPLVSLLVIVPAGPSVTFSIVPATGYSEIELTDCEGYAMPTVTSCGPPRLSAPYRPNPPDGATDVPTNQLLSYVGVANSVGIGTSPNLGQVICQGEPPCALPLNPGLLAPHTTYYWRAGTVCFCDGVLGGTSELFSFTTGDGPLAVEATTWGRVKALYRE